MQGNSSPAALQLRNGCFDMVARENARLSFGGAIRTGPSRNRAKHAIYRQLDPGGAVQPVHGGQQFKTMR